MGAEFSGLGLEDHGADDVARQQVRGELDPLELSLLLEAAREERGDHVDVGDVVLRERLVDHRLARCEREEVRLAGNRDPLTDEAPQTEVVGDEVAAGDGAEVVPRLRSVAVEKKGRHRLDGGKRRSGMDDTLDLRGRGFVSAIRDRIDDEVFPIEPREKSHHRLSGAQGRHRDVQDLLRTPLRRLGLRGDLPHGADAAGASGGFVRDRAQRRFDLHEERSRIEQRSNRGDRNEERADCCESSPCEEDRAVDVSAGKEEQRLRRECQERER